MRRQRTFVALAALLALSAIALPAEAQAGEDEASIALPVSFDKVWFRPGPKSEFAGGKQTGLLTVSESGLEFSAKKHSHVLPWSRIEMISYGRMAGDTDTKWVVLSLKSVAGEWGQAGLRDGRKMGYGQSTPTIFETIVAGLRQAAAGPFAVPPGHSAYLTPFLQFTLAVPDGWNAFSVRDTYVGGLPLWGRTIFSPLDLAGFRDDEARLKQALSAIRNGSSNAVFLDRFEADDGFTCRRLTKAGRRALRSEIDAALKPLRLMSEPQWIERAHRHCTAWTFAGRAVTKEEATIDVGFYAVSDGQTVYLFGTRGSESQRFEQIARSLRAAVAR